MTTAILIAINAAWLALATTILRRQLARDSLAFRALGWNEHREQALALCKRKHPRDRSGKYTTAKGGGK